MTTKRFIVIAGIVLTALTGAGLTLYSWNEWMLRPASLEIGLVWPETTDLFFDGAKLAVRDVNDAGGLFHQQLTIAVPPQEPGGAAGASTNSVTAGTDTAIVTANALLAAHPDLLAVVGHRDPMEAIPAANVYESNKVLFLSPTGTQSRLTGLKFEHVFRLLPDNTERGKLLARYCNSRGYKRVAVLHDRTEISYEVADAFSAEALDALGMSIPFKRSFFVGSDDRELTKLAVELRRIEGFDAVLVVTNDDLGSRVLAEARRRWVEAPFVGNESMDTPLFWGRIKEWERENGKAADMVVPTVFYTHAPEARRFAERFQLVFGKAPDRNAALAYDAVNLIAHGLKFSKRPVSIKVADELRYMAACQGVTGAFKFSDYGDVEGRTLYFKGSAAGDEFLYRDVAGHDIQGNPEEGSIPRCNDMDADDDNVFDNFDRCPNNTPEELAKGVFMDGERQGCPMDTDLDGHPDIVDQCPGDAKEAVAPGVSAEGCPMDKDGDGLLDYQDACPLSTPDDLRLGRDARGCPLDSDADQVPDIRDACPRNSQVEIAAGIDARGCPLDSDHDGVEDYRDACPKDAEEAIALGVDAHGCPTDSDGDRVPNYRDRCPTDSADQNRSGVDTHGCPTDTDGDKVPDYRDVCPGESPEIVARGVSANGCAADSDGDGVPDYLDNCRDNGAAEIEAGVDTKGCPLDKDADHVPDYRDRCPANTAEELRAGVGDDGCPPDADGDGVIDAFDACASDQPEMLTQGVDTKGCPVDSDSDGVPDYRDTCRTNAPQELTSGVNADGCPRDGDKDGVADFRDACPTYTQEAIAHGVDDQGCPTDSDHDGVPDFRDVCRNDTAQQLVSGVDATGCPVDTDGDKVPDHGDRCPRNRAEELAGGVDQQGCP